MNKVKMRAPAGMTGGINGLPGVYIIDGIVEVEQAAVASLAASGFSQISVGEIGSATTVADLIPFIQGLQAELAVLKEQNELIISRASTAMKAALGL